MHVGWLSTLLLPRGSDALDAQALARRIAARLHLAPRFRQRLAASPVGEPGVGGRPRVSPRPARPSDRGSAADSSPARCDGGAVPLGLSSTARDRCGRSRWCRVLPTTGARRSSGRSTTRWSTGSPRSSWGCCSSTLRRTRRLPDRVDWAPERAAGPLQLAAGSVVDGAIEQFRAARRVASLGMTPRKTVRIAETMRRAALQVAEDVVQPAPPSFLNRDIGPKRALVCERMPVGASGADQGGAGREAERRRAGGGVGRASPVLGAPRRGAEAVAGDGAGERPRRGGERGQPDHLRVPRPPVSEEPRPLRRLSVIHGRHSGAQAVRADRGIRGDPARRRPATGLPQGARGADGREPAHVQRDGLERARPSREALRRRRARSRRSIR